MTSARTGPVEKWNEQAQHASVEMTVKMIDVQIGCRRKGTIRN
jgi:hypothetical protein